MKRIFIILFTFINLTIFGQNIDDILTKRSLKTDSLAIELQKYNIEDEQVTYLQNARKTLKSVVNEILKLENFNNKPMQKVLLKPIQDYYEAFNVEKDGKKINTLNYGFENKEDFIYSYKISEALLLSKLIDKQYSVLILDSERKLKELTNYINQNLKRLGITKEQYDKLSENDKRLLEKQFE